MMPSEYGRAALKHADEAAREDRDPQNGALSNMLNQLEKQVIVARDQVDEMGAEFNFFLRPAEPMDGEVGSESTRESSYNSPLTDQLEGLVVKMEFLNGQLRTLRNRNDLGAGSKTITGAKINGF